MVVTAALVVAYTALFDSGAKVPFDDDVFTTCPGPPCSSSSGTNVLMPLITPNTFTSTAHRQSLTWCCHNAPSDPEGMPALLHTRCTEPKRSSVASRSCLTESSRETSVTTPIDVVVAVAELGDGGVEQRFVDVGQHDPHPLGEEPLAQRPTDPATATGDDRDFAHQVLHGGTVTPWIGTPSSPPTAMPAPTSSTTDRSSEARYHDAFDDWAAAFVSPYGDLVQPDADRNWDSNRRMRELEADGVVGEIVYPNTIPPFFPRGSLVAVAPSAGRLRAAARRPPRAQPVARRLVRRVPERRAGIGQILLNDVDEAVRDVHWIADHGLRGGVLLPGVPPDAPIPPLHARLYDPVWRACEERGVNVNAHGGSSSPTTASTRRRSRCGWSRRPGSRTGRCGPSSWPASSTGSRGSASCSPSRGAAGSARRST